MGHGVTYARWRRAGWITHPLGDRFVKGLSDAVRSSWTHAENIAWETGGNVAVHMGVLRRFFRADF